MLELTWSALCQTRAIMCERLNFLSEPSDRAATIRGRPSWTYQPFFYGSIIFKIIILRAFLTSAQFFLHREQKQNLRLFVLGEIL